MPGIAPRQVRAYAKVNLALAVGPPIPAGEPHAGLHHIASWMHAIGLHDDIEIAPAETSSYDIAWSDGSAIDWATEDDLCVRSHRAVESAVGRALPIALRVRKSIPSGGGLGGGSADAGCVLLALRDVFGLDMTDEQIGSIAHGIGTDIPFFVDPDAWRAGQAPRPAIVTGVGDRIERIDRRSDPITLHCPGFGCATGAVYGMFDRSPTATCDEPRVRTLAVGDPIDDAGLFNDLALPAESVEPRLAAVRRAIADRSGKRVHVSGSGSTMFTLGPPGDGGDSGTIETALV